MPDRFRVEIPGLWREPWPTYFDRFWSHCRDKATANDWQTITVANYELAPLGGRVIQTRTQGWYLRWDNEASHTAFVLRWS